MKTLIGLVIVIVAILGVLWYMRNNESFLPSLFDTSESIEVTDETAEQNPTGTDMSDSSGDSDPDPDQSLHTCTSELLTQNCMAVSKDPVCSIDTVEREDGSTQQSSTEYISACHYCKFFGPDGTVPLGYETISSDGYTTGSCSL